MSQLPYGHGHGHPGGGPQRPRHQAPAYQQPIPPQYAPAPPPPAPKKRRVWPWVVLGVFAFFVVIGSIGASNDKPSTSRAAAPSSSPTVAYSAPAAAAPVAEDEPALSGITPGTIPAGTWLVGSEVEPGTYRSAGVDEGIIEYCQVTTEDADGHVMEWKNVGQAGAPLTVKVSKNAETVTNSGCATFTKVG